MDFLMMWKVLLHYCDLIMYREEPGERPPAPTNRILQTVSDSPTLRLPQLQRTIVRPRRRVTPKSLAAEFDDRADLRHLEGWIFG